MKRLELAMAFDPAILMETLGLPPDPWQCDVLRSSEDRLLLLCSRQCGKSTTTAILALHTALFVPDSLILLLSPSQRQSKLLFDTLTGFYRDLGRPVAPEEETATTLALVNRSRIVSLPASPETIRGYAGVRLLVIDEAAFVPDDLYVAVTPMLSVSRGRLVCLSSPLGKRGWFYEAWQNPDARWRRFRVTAPMCPRHSPEFLAEEKRNMGERWFNQEYMCSFQEAVDQAFSTESILSAFESDTAPLFG
jgi:hypothetical protein